MGRDEAAAAAEDAARCMNFIVMSREDIGLAGLPVGVGGLDILTFFFLPLCFLFMREMEREE